MTKQTKSLGPRIKALLVAFGSDLETAMKLAPRRITYRWLEREAEATPGVRLPKASIWRILNGESPEPDWKMIERFLSLIGVSEEAVASDWRPKYETLIKSIQAVGLTEILQAGPGVECPTCGAAVLNEARHEEYHAEQEALVRRRLMRAIRSVPAESLAG